jgi:hypothetical protein
MTIIMAWQSIAVSLGLDARTMQTIASLIYGIGYCNLGRWAWKAVLRERRYTYASGVSSTVQIEASR